MIQCCIDFATSLRRTCSNPLRDPVTSDATLRTMIACRRCPFGRRAAFTSLSSGVPTRRYEAVSSVPARPTRAPSPRELGPPLADQRPSRCLRCSRRSSRQGGSLFAWERTSRGGDVGVLAEPVEHAGGWVVRNELVGGLQRHAGTWLLSGHVDRSAATRPCWRSQSWARFWRLFVFADAGQCRPSVSATACSSRRKSGCAISASARARSRTVSPANSAAPYSVTTTSTW
jgi:hypothetical protein